MKQFWLGHRHSMINTIWAVYNNNNTHLMAVYPWQPGWASTRNLNRPPSLSSNSSLALPTFPPRPHSQPLGSLSILRRTWWKQLKETRRTRWQEPTLPLHLPNSGFDEAPWLITGPLSLTPLTVWPLAATQTRARVNQAMHLKVFLSQMPFLLQPSPFQPCGPAQNMLLRIPWGSKLSKL